MSRSGTTSCVTHGATANARHLWLCGLSGPRLRARDRGVSLAFPPLSLGSHLANGSRTNLNSANRNPRLKSGQTSNGTLSAPC